MRQSQSVGQRIVTRLKSFKRDWYLDTEANIDWFNLLGKRGVRVQEIEQQVERVTLATDGVARVNNITANFDRVTRRLAIDIDVTDIYGEQIAIRGLAI